MLVWIYGYLINLQTCSMILVVKVAEHHDTFGTLSVGKEMEVEQHYLALEVGKIAYHTLVVCQREVDASIYAHLAGINLSLCHLVFHDANVLHALDGDIVEVLATLSVRIVSIPTGSYGSKHLDVILVVAWIEQQGVGATYLNGLEKSIVGRSLHWSLEDILGLDVLLVAVDHLSYCHVHGVNSHVWIFGDTVDGSLQVHLLERQFLDGRTVLRTFHFVFVSHRRVCSLYEDGFRRVNREVDGLVGNTQAIELRRNRVHGIFFESEGTVFAQLH